MHFRSAHIIGFLVGGLLLTALAGGWAFVGMRNLQWKSAQEQEVELVMRAIEGGALKFAQLNSTGLAAQFLGSHFAALSPDETPRFLSARIEGGRDGKATYAVWAAPRRDEVPSTCDSRFERMMSPDGALYPFKVTVVANACWENPSVTSLIRAALWAPLIVSCGLLGVIGLSLVAMMESVRRASVLLRKSPDSVEVVTAASRVPWKEVREMLSRALETSGVNLHYFQAIIEEAEHDVNREINRSSSAHESSHGRTISSILRKLVMDSRIAVKADALGEAPHRKTMSLSEISCFLQDQGFLVDASNIQEFLCVTLPDGDAFTRLVLNLGSNARKHARGPSHARITLVGEALRIDATNPIGLGQALRLRLASALGNLDVHDPNLPLVRTWWSREGIGSRVLKRSAMALGADLSVSLQRREFTATIALRIQLLTQTKPSRIHRRAVGFLDQSLIEAVRSCGFSGDILSPDEIRTRVAKQEIDEILVDFPLPNAPDAIVIRNATTASRVRGVVTYWQKGIV